MRWRIRDSIRRRSLRETVEIAADTALVFAHWTRYERFPEFMQSVQRTKRISDRRVLWDVVIAGRQLVWEAHVEAVVPDTLIRWESRWGTRMAGEVRFEPLGPGRTRLVVEIEYAPDGLIERIGARLGWVDDCVRRELAAFRDHVEANTEAAFRLHPFVERGPAERERARSGVRPIQATRSSAERLSRWRAGSAAPPLRGEPKTASGPSR